MKLVDKIESGKLISFDVKARMEENERFSGLVTVGFSLNVGTKPNMVKFLSTLTTQTKNSQQMTKKLKSQEL